MIKLVKSSVQNKSKIKACAKVLRKVSNIRLVSIKKSVNENYIFILFIKI